MGVQINTWRILKIITLVQLYQWYSVSVTPWKQITVLNVSSPLENLDVTFLSWQEMLLFTIAQCTMHCTIAPLHNFNAQHDFNARQIVLWKRLVMPFVANICCWMWGCEDDLRLTSSSMIMLQHARRDPSLSNHQSTPHPNQPCHHLLMTNLHDHTHLTYGPTKQNLLRYPWPVVQ